MGDSSWSSQKMEISTFGGPWTFKEDTSLIQVLKEGEETVKVTFTRVPIWVQFKDFSFYLLSKELEKYL
jgi:hypothetical protein